MSIFSPFSEVKAVVWIRIFFYILFLLSASIVSPLQAEDILPSFSNKTLPLCWSDRELQRKKGEEHIQSRINAAFRIPPTGRPQKPEIPSSQWRHALGQVIRRVNLPKGVKKIALTFDLCEQPHEVAGYQGDIIDLLRTEKVSATFFSGGKWMLTHQQRAQQLMTDPLFEMANHSWEHRNLRLLKGKSLTDSLERSQLAYSQVRNRLKNRQCRSRAGQTTALGHSPGQMSLFRFPFGACDKASMKAVGKAGLLSIQWDVAAGDPVKGQSAKRIKRIVLRNARPGSIVIFHANGRGWNTPKALPDIIRSLKKQGYKFVTVSQLLNSKGAKWEIKDSCYDHHPGDSVRYDKVARRLHAFYNRAALRHRLRSTGTQRKFRKPHYKRKKKLAKARHKTRHKKHRTQFRPFSSLHNQ